MAALGWLLNLGFGGSEPGGTAAPQTSFTAILLLSAQRGTIALVSTSAGTVLVTAVQLVREEFPYTFPIDFTATQSGVTFQGGNVRLLSG